ncbi:MAG: hypothetical protein JNK74_04615 [Candidatus Hydrogenedentes bacterium]|nr:hypothetical protein [Candidatus Hydrogenedentota bacterium]
MTSSIRKRAGAAKWWLQCHSPQTLFHQWRSHTVRARLRERFDNMQPLPLPDKGELEIHTLCGHNQVDMAVWSLRSLCRYGSVSMPVYVHSDGSLTEEDSALLSRLFPGVKIVDKSEADRTWKQQQSSAHAHLDTFRRDAHCGRKLVDPHLFGESKWLFLMDTDILFFEEPVRMLEMFNGAVSKEELTYISWNAADGLAASSQELSERVGWEPVSRFNAGALFLPRFDKEAWATISSIVNSFPQEWVRHFWIEQTVYALIAAKYAYRTLPPNYEVGINSRKNCVARHYVGVPTVRPRMFTQGIPQSLRNEDA